VFPVYCTRVPFCLKIYRLIIWKINDDDDDDDDDDDYIKKTTHYFVNLSIHCDRFYDFYSRFYPTHHFSVNSMWRPCYHTIQQALF